jgi:hypothetical protein
MEVVKMKKSKKFLSILLSAAMACSMIAMPVFAGDDEGSTEQQPVVKTDTVADDGRVTPASTTTGLTELPFTKMLTTNGTQILTETTFYFTMEPASPSDETKDSLPWKTGIALKTDQASITLSSSDWDNIKTYSGSSTDTEGEVIVPGFTKSAVSAVKLDGTFDLTLAEGESFEENTAAIYHYKVIENPDSKASGTITYDQRTYYVDLYVDSNGVINYAQSNVGSSKKPIVFENDFRTGSLTITKTVNGNNPTEADKEFQFWIKIPTGGDSIDLSENLSIKAFKISGTNSSEFSGIKVGGTKEQEQNPSTAYKTDGDTGWCGFTLKNGESLEITGLPVGMIYYLMEEDYTDENFDTHYIAKSVAASETVTAPEEADYLDATKNGTEGRIIASSESKISNSKNYIYYLNTHNVPTPTGIAVDILPYAVVVLAAVAAFAVLLISKKRRNAR